jgi:hypothetical protein
MTEPGRTAGPRKGISHRRPEPPLSTHVHLRSTRCSPAQTADEVDPIGAAIGAVIDAAIGAVIGAVNARPTPTSTVAV